MPAKLTGVGMKERTSRTSGGRGVVSLCNAPTGCVGQFSSANALIGGPGDNVGVDGIVTLSNGNYVVVSRLWNSQRGAVTWGNGAAGTVGEVSASNSLVGAAANDFVGNGGVTPLSNGNYVIASTVWKNGSSATVGAV